MIFTKFGKQKGFSLVELLVVVGIIGVLAAVGVPKYQRYMARSKNVAALTRGSEIAKSEEIYKINSNNYANTTATLDPTSEIPTIPGTYFNTVDSWGAANTTTWSWASYAALGNLGSCQSGLHTVSFNQAGMGVNSDVVPGC